MKFNALKFYTTLTMLFVSILSFAQDLPPVDPPADNDAPAAPINSYLIWLAILGVSFILYTLNKRNSIKESK